MFDQSISVPVIITELIRRTIMRKLEQLIYLFIAAGISMLIGVGCSKKDSPPEPTVTLAVLTTDSATEVTSGSAKGGGTITSGGGATVTERGLCWARHADPVIVSDYHLVLGSGTGQFTGSMPDLDTNTSYWFRAYAINSKGIAYGNTRTFHTLHAVVYGRVSDFDGNNYPVIRIGTQYWMGGNLRVNHYRNGDAIPVVIPDAQWKVLTSGAYCVYDNDTANARIYGNLYNWHALNDPRGICPAGWHIPSDGEWAVLGSVLGGNSMAGGKLKTPGTIEAGSGLWYAPNTGATNSSNFSGIPAGMRINYGNYYSIGNVAMFWATTDTAAVNAWTYVLDANNEKLGRTYNFKTNGFSVRCLRD